MVFNCNSAISFRLMPTLYANKYLKIIIRPINKFVDLKEIAKCVRKILADKNTDQAKPHSICFSPQYQRQRTCFFLECDQDRDRKKE